MLKLEIKLNDEKILTENIYQLEGIYRAIEKVFEDNQLLKKMDSDGTMTFYGTGSRKDYAAFGRIITWLKKEKWFMDNVTKWVWYNSDNGNSDEDFSIEDVLYHYTKKTSVA